MKNQRDIFPGENCYIFDFLKHSYCARFEKVRVPSREELTAMWKRQGLIADAEMLILSILSGYNLNMFLPRGVV